MPNANGDRYKVEPGPGINDQINAIKAISKQAGKFERFIAILEDAMRRLEFDPHAWGDPVYRSKTVDAVACRGILPPIVFHYVIYEQVRSVMLLRVELYADFD
jgi:hypothetical protein